MKKLEETSLPEIEIPSHKRKLKDVLLSKYYKEKRSWEIFNVFKRVVPVGAVAIVLVIFILNNFIFPKYTLAKAKEIALQNSQVKEWVKQGAIIKDAKIIENKAFVLIQPVEKIEEVSGVKAPAILEEKKEEFNGALAEINLKERKITEIKQLTPEILSLTEEEKEKVKEIAEENREIQKVIQKEAKIKEIRLILPPQLKLIKEKDLIKVVPEEKRTKIIYEFDNNLLEGEVDLIKGELKTIKFKEEIEEIEK